MPQWVIDTRESAIDTRVNYKRDVYDVTMDESYIYDCPVSNTTLVVPSR